MTPQVMRSATFPMPANVNVTAEDLDWLRGQIGRALHHGDDHERKTLLQTLTHEIRVEGRNSIRPTYRLPSRDASSQAAVREPDAVVGLSSFG
jgi:hypothetical protein